ncbi:hypothetical protein TWF217_005119 [Orbilia oligospora]|nr:hypothetical protein TWF217_005119 [Orbilia oligospora]
MNDFSPTRAFRPNSNPRESTALHLAYILGFCIFYVPVELVIFSIRRVSGVRSNRIPILTDLARTLNRKASTTIPGSTLHFLSLDIAGRKVLSSRRYSRYCKNIYHGLNHPAVSGYWISCGSIAEKCQPRDCDFVVLIIHGGGYVRGHPAILLPGYLRMGEIFSNYGLKVGLFALEYTLAPASAFPTQIGQARAAYDYLVTDCGLVFPGDYAGGPRTETSRTYRNFAAGPPNHLGASWKRIFPKTCWISAGGDELFLPDIQKFVDYAEGAGATIDLEVAPVSRPTVPHQDPVKDNFSKTSQYYLAGFALRNTVTPPHFEPLEGGYITFPSGGVEAAHMGDRLAVFPAAVI